MKNYYRNCKLNFKMKKILISWFLITLVSSCQSDGVNNSISTPKKELSISNIKISPCSALPQRATYEEVSMNSYTYQEGRMMFIPQNIRLGTQTIDADSLPYTNTKKGSHIHLNISNQKHHLSNRGSFEYHLPDGQYQLFSFINRSYFIAIKNPNSLIAKSIKIKNNKLASSKNLEEAAIIYNMPHGLYKNEAAKQIVLDFLLYQTSIGKGKNTIRVTIDENTVFIIDEYQPYLLEGIEVGEHRCTLELLNRKGQAISSPISNTFIVSNEPKES